MQKIHIRKLYCVVCLIVVILGAIGMFWKNTAHQQPKDQDIPLVRTTVVKSGQSTNAYSYSGEVKGRFESQLAFQVTGKIIKRNVELGSHVKAGEVLMLIDPKDLNQAANSSSAQVFSAESQLRLAEKNLERYRQLYEQGAVSRSQYDQYETAYDSAVAAVRQTSAQYTQAANQVDYSQLYSDAAGVVSAINAETGQVVSAGQTVVTVVREGEREVEISVPENRINEFRQAQAIKITFWALPGVAVEGSIREISPMADKTSRTYKVRISMKGINTEIKLGMTANVEVGAASGLQNEEFFVPLTAIYQTGIYPAVWVIVDNVATLRPVKTGNVGDGNIQIIEGLHSGDMLVTAGVHKLREGQKVSTAGGNL